MVDEVWAWRYSGVKGSGVVWAKKRSMHIFNNGCGWRDGVYIVWSRGSSRTDT